MSENWIDDLKPSDSVIVVGNGNQLDDILQVDRLTKTQVVLINTSSRFSRSDGRLIGASVWNTQSLKMATPQRIEKIKIANRRSKFIYFLRNIKWSDVSSEKLEEIWNSSKRLEWLEYHKQGRRDKIPLCSKCEYWGISNVKRFEKISNNK